MNNQATHWKTLQILNPPLREGIIDALNWDWDGSAYGSIITADITGIEVQGDNITFEIRGGDCPSPTLTTTFILQAFLRTLFDIEV